jgi:hypothetical protein
VEINLGRWPRRFSCAADADVTPEGLRRQADDIEKELASEVDYQMTQRKNKMLRRANWRLILAALVSCALVTAFLSVRVTSGLGIFILIVASLIIVCGVLSRFFFLQQRLGNITDDGAQEKSDIKRTLNQASDELARFFSQNCEAGIFFPSFGPTCWG